MDKNGTPYKRASLLFLLSTLGKYTNTILKNIIGGALYIKATPYIK